MEERLVTLALFLDSVPPADWVSQRHAHPLLRYGFYYAWITHYTQWLTPLAFAGVGLLILELVMELTQTGGNPRDPEWGSDPWGRSRLRTRNMFGLGLSLWAVAQLCRWRQRTYELCVRWDLV